MGTIYTIHVEAGQFLPSWRPNSDYRNTVSASKELGGGVMTELSHELDYISWIFGKPTWVNAQNGKISNLEVNVEDYSKINFNDIAPYMYPRDKDAMQLNLRGIYLSNFMDWNYKNNTEIVTKEWGFNSVRYKRERTFNLFAKMNGNCCFKIVICYYLYESCMI